MTRNATTICSVLLSAALLALSAPAHAQKDFDRSTAGKAIAESKSFQECHTNINLGDTCNWAIFTGRWNLIAERWGSAAAHPQPDDLKGNAVGYWLYKNKGYLQLSPNEMVALSDKGRAACRDWRHVTAPGKEAESSQTNFEAWDVPLAAKKFITITRVLRGSRMRVQFAEVHYLWSYALTPLGVELFQNQRIPSAGKNVGGWIAPAELTGIDPNKIYPDKAIFVLHTEGWRLVECQTIDACD